MLAVRLKMWYNKEVKGLIEMPETHQKQISENPESIRQDQPENSQRTQKVSAFRNAREIAANEKRKEELKERERQKKAEEAAYQEREEYAKELQEEKIDLIRLKQGLIGEDAFQKEEETKKYTLRQKIANWFYHAKWWLGIAAFCSIVAGYLIFDYVSRKDPDIAILVLTDNIEVNRGSDSLCSWLKPMCEDYNKDGKIIVQAVYVPVSDSTMKAGPNASTSNMQLGAQLETDTCMLVLSDQDADKYYEPGHIFMNMEELYPDCPLAQDYKLNICGSSFEKQLNLTEPLPESTYLAIRIPSETFSSQKEMQKSYDRAKKFLDQLVETLTEEAKSNE